ncbi:hypothetical protein [Streptomyces scabiei]|uniref:hypothetical protein n=1 Tax=Streptomyces scabiei TaxID=1930 RepID=UPI0029BD1511|nr:hypothetical protein [Streptomyces scabiei]MDX3026767.1 hypothetical protein [Streptomyces scabiei]MDX3210045.1 hypothetical protein [Streptomyces scabiei]
MTRTLPTPPPRIARLPRNQAGYPIPWFVDYVDGEPDFRIADTRKQQGASVFRCCWLCGHALRNNVLGPAATQYAYVIGPMCAVNRVSSEPPAHRDCAVYAVTACPFLTTPGMRRRAIEGIPDTVKPDGVMIERNPGVALVWVTNTWRMIPGHALFDVDEPAEALWFAEGRPATHAEVLAAIDSGMPVLREAAEQDNDPEAALAYLDQQYARALELLPAETAVG